MPRRVFLADLQRVSNHSGVDGISRVSPGRNDGEFIVTVQPKSGKPFELFITIPGQSLILRLWIYLLTPFYRDC